MINEWRKTMKNSKIKQLLAWGLAAGLTVSNLGTAFAAYHVGTPGASERDEVISLTLNGEGGRFTVTPSGSNAAEKLTSVVIESEANNTDGSNYYAPFGAFSLASGSNADYNFILDGPDVKPVSQPGVSFDGWYGSLMDPASKLNEDTMVYSGAQVNARWVEKVETPAELEKDVKNVEVSGLKDVRITAVENAAQKEQIETNLARLALESDQSVSYEVTGTPVLLDIKAQTVDSSKPGLITMQIPESLAWEKAEEDDVILVMHFAESGDTLAEKDGMQTAVIDDEKQTMTFRASSFSPYAIARAKENKTATVLVENVKGGALIAYSRDNDGKVTLVPIGEEVAVPEGTVLHVEESAMYTAKGATRLKQNEAGARIICVEQNGVKDTEHVVYEPITVTGRTVLSAEFVPQSSDEDSKDEIADRYYWNLNPSRMMEAGYYEGEIRLYEVQEDGRSVRVENFTAELADTEDYAARDNDKFEVVGKQVKSKEKLESGKSYRIALNIFLPDGTPVVGWSADDAETLKALAYGGRTISVGVTYTFTAWMLQYTYDEEHAELTYDGYYIGNILMERGIAFKEARKIAFEERGITEIAMYGHEFDGWVDEQGTKVAPDMKPTEDYNNFYATFKGYKPVKVLALGEEAAEPNFVLYGSSPMKVGEKQVLRINGTDVADAENITWESSAPSVVSVEKKDKTTATATAKKAGKATITATITIDGQDVTCKKEITVVADGSQGTGGSGSGWVKPAGSGSSSQSGTSTVGGWTRDTRGWRYLAADGTVLKGQWEMIKNVWYYFGADGYMLTGWQFINGKWYYLNEAESGMGAMVTGWHQNLQGTWFYLGADGAMLTGWQLVNGVWYYLNTGSDGTVGALAVNTQIGDYHVDANGAWIR